MLWNRILTLTVFLSPIEAHKILGVFHVPVQSHNKLVTKLFSEIAKNGHEVTLITPFKGKTIVANLTEVVVEDLRAPLDDDLIDWSQNLDSNSPPLASTAYIWSIQYVAVEKLLRSREVQEILRSKQSFDAVIIWQYMNGALYSLAQRFQAPLILFSSVPLFPQEKYYLSQPNFPSYVPHVFADYATPMNFWQRLRNTLYDMATIINYAWYKFPKHIQLSQKYVSEKCDLYKLYSNVSLVLINTHVSTNEITPSMPKVLEIGGYHIEEPKPLAKDLQMFLDGSSNGVILFSMGSQLKSTNFPEETINAILRAFAAREENILWKFEGGDLPNVPRNVKIMKWLPQTDVLAHTNIRAFITHGGLLSTIESTYFGKPVIGIPYYLDQKMNVAFMVARGCGVKIPYGELTEEKLEWALEEILKPKYRKNMEKRSLIMKDRVRKPLEDALYWIEYVIRHRGNLG